MEQNRLKSPVVWAALAAQALTILVTLGAIDTGLSDAINAALAGVLQLLVMVGVLNNPTDGEHF
ncbi:MAG: holin [Clostridiales bacterium]|nr:holin [Clostridiales bacterium]